MSILLDALRKSEQRERLGATPDIHSAEPATDGAAANSRPWLILVLLLIVVALAAWGGWRWWSGQAVPTAAPEYTEVVPGASAAAGEPDPAPPPVPATSDDAAARGDGQAVNSTQDRADASTDSGGLASGPAPPRLDRQPRSPVERLDGDRVYEPARPAAPAATAPAREIPQISDKDLELAASQAEAAAEARARRQRAGSMPQPAPETPRRPRRDRDEGLISYWQLPENVRGGLPELKINVMVFDEDPDRRFIIMSGKRYSQKSEVAGDLSLEEVRRDRAIFRYGAYRFYVKQ